jgi:NDP-sugar pyrophosphorylase family protein
MRAMVLAAGLGTRLRPLTNDRPKALIEINGRTLLEMTLARLRQVGIREVIINTHHLADTIVSYLEANKNFGMTIAISREDELLDTGGGLKKASHFFLEQDSGEPFLVHNVDVVGSIDLGRMIEFHRQHAALAMLAVQRRATSRQLLFDDELQLCGRKSKDSPPELMRPIAKPQPLAFCGIHVISPRIFALMSEEGAFSIITTYLRLAQQGERIVAFSADEYYWRDVGNPESLQQAADDLAEGRAGTIL